MRLEKLSRQVLLSFVSIVQNSFHPSIGLLIFFKQIFIYEFVITFVIQIQPVLKAKPSILFIFCSNKETRIVKKIAGKRFARAAHVFVHFFAVVFSRLQRETSRNFLVTRYMEEMLYVYLFNVFFVFHVANFYTGGSKHFSFSHRRNKISLSLQFFPSLSFAGLSPYFLFFSAFLYIPNLWA